MRKRYQAGSVTKSGDGRYWLGKYRLNGRHKTRLLGKVRQMTKSKAREELGTFLSSLIPEHKGGEVALRNFVENVYFRLYEKKWKGSTLGTNQDRITREILGRFGDRDLRTIDGEELQTFLDSRSGMSFSTVDHLRWDLKQIFNLAVARRVIPANPAALLFTPRECKKPHLPTMSLEEIGLSLTVLDLRERLAVKLAVLAGMRPGEVFALRRKGVVGNVVNVCERVYRGKLDTPKTRKSTREFPVVASVLRDLEDWLEESPDTGPEGFLFPSETLGTPLSAGNVMRRNIRPRLKLVGLEWVNFQIMRKTHSTIMDELGADPKVVADMMGHNVDVNLNVYTDSSMKRKFRAVQRLEAAFGSLTR